MSITNWTPVQLYRSPSNTYPIRATFKPRASRFCRFTNERLIAVIDGVPHHMARMITGSDEWIYTHYASGTFDLAFIGRFKAKPFIWAPYTDGMVGDGPHHIQIVAAPDVTIAPTELMFYFESEVPNVDQTAVLHNGLLTAVQVSSASIQGTDAGAFTLISPTVFDFLLAPNGSTNFVVRFTNDTRQREARLVINTGQGTRSVRLSGKYFIW